LLLLLLLEMSDELFFSVSFRGVVLHIALRPDGLGASGEGCPQLPVAPP
jgi:hypothetical protein